MSSTRSPSRHRRHRRRCRSCRSGAGTPPRRYPASPKRLPPKIRVSDVVEEVTSLLRVLASCDDAIDRRAIQELEDQAVLAFWLAEPVR
jgi:hypothetical protein